MTTQVASHTFASLEREWEALLPACAVDTIFLTPRWQRVWWETLGQGEMVLLAIREEIKAVQNGEISAEDSPLHHAPHTADQVTADHWDRPYTRQTAAFPAPWVYENKFWPAVARIDNTYGDRNLVCACPPLESYA